MIGFTNANVPPANYVHGNALDIMRIANQILKAETDPTDVNQSF
jgi:hypothetical protein